MNAEVPIAAYLILAAILFSIGIGSFLIKRNVISIFMSIELMLNAVNLTFVAFAHRWHAVSGQIFVFFVMVVAAAEQPSDSPSSSPSSAPARPSTSTRST